ncbi:MAG: hypothetical protein ACLPZR_31845 [Solirubrobacteraceae bacterium]
MAYALQRLGWLQFQQLCEGLLELDGGIPAAAWTGAADRWRTARSETPVGPPLLARELPGPVLVQCAWLRPGLVRSRLQELGQLAHEQRHEFEKARSYVLMCNASVDLSDLAEPAATRGVQLAALGAGELGARIDARADLRLAMPSLLGLRELGDLIDPAVAAASSLDRPGASDLAAVFVPTRAYRRTVGVLAEHRFAVLTGPPEMGKTAIARMVGLARMTAGWEAHECNDPDDVFTALRRGRAQLFIADDAFGSTEYRADAAERWARAIERLLRSLDDRHVLIWTSRPAPLHAALRRLHRERGAERFPAPARVLVDASDLSVSEKTLILFRHAKAAQLPGPVRAALRRHGPEIVAKPHFTPERIRRLVERLAGGADDVAAAAATELTTATEAMVASFSTLAAEHRDVLVALLDAPPGPVAERELVSALRRHHDGALSQPPAELVDRLADHFVRVLA